MYDLETIVAVNDQAASNAVIRSVILEAALVGLLAKAEQGSMTAAERDALKLICNQLEGEVHSGQGA